MSAAFDVVDHTLLLKKLELYGMDSDSLGWVRSYLDGRSQSVMIEGCLSKLLSVNSGVPQGSILGPLLYTLFTNELPEVIHDNANLEGVWPAYQVEAVVEGDGDICCYADDTTLSMSASDPATLSANLSSKYNLVA